MKVDPIVPMATYEELYDPDHDSAPDNGQPRGVGEDLFADVERFIADYVAFPSTHALVATVLWCVHSHLVGAVESSPRLALLSPEKQCGKTRLLEVIELLCAGAERLSDASPSYMFRRIGAGAVTVLLDEADAVWKRGKADESAEALRSIINEGHRQGGFVGRVSMNGQKAELTRFHVYAPVALAGIGNCLPDTILDRAVIIRMRRRAPDEQVSEFRVRTARPRGEALRQRLADWAVTVVDRVGDPWPDMPAGVTDRPADVWEALLMVADLAGGGWPDRAREACKAFVTNARDDTASVGVKLLTDLLDVFRDGNEPRKNDPPLLGKMTPPPLHPLAPALSTETILGHLHKLDESPWGEWYGHPLTARELAKLLKPYGITSRAVRIGDGTPRGYRREDMWDAWLRYLPDLVPGSATSATSTTPLASTVADVAHVAHTGASTDDEGEDQPCLDRSSTAPSANASSASDGSSSGSTPESLPALDASKTATSTTSSRESHPNGVGEPGYRDCKDCGAPARDISGLCDSCIEAKRSHGRASCRAHP